MKTELDTNEIKYLKQAIHQSNRSSSGCLILVLAILFPLLLSLNVNMEPSTRIFLWILIVILILVLLLAIKIVLSPDSTQLDQFKVETKYGTITYEYHKNESKGGPGSYTFFFNTKIITVPYEWHSNLGYEIKHSKNKYTVKLITSNDQSPITYLIEIKDSNFNFYTYVKSV